MAIKSRQRIGRHPPCRGTETEKPADGCRFFSLFKGSDHHGGAADADHQHAAVLPHHLVVDVDANHGVGTQGGGAFFELIEGNLAGAGQLFFVGAGAAAYDVADPGKEIFEDVGAEDGFANDDAAIFTNGLAFQGGGG